MKELYLRELVGNQLLIMPLNKEGRKKIEDALEVMEITLNIFIENKMNPKQILLEFKIILDSIIKAKKDKNHFLKIDLVAFKNIIQILEDSIKSKSVNEIMKKKYETDYHEIIILKNTLNVFNFIIKE
jgi:hypothetical protein